MYPSSTQKKHWTFKTQEEIDTIRAESNEKYRVNLRPYLADPELEEKLLTPEDETILCRIVSETGIRFGDEFQPRLRPSVRWTAFAFFKRFFLRYSAMEYSPKNIMMAAYFLAMKIDEFPLSIHDFISNLQSGTREQNAESILKWEPIIMFKLDYQLTVHCPFRPFEGHLIEMKTHGNLGFDLEGIREHSDAFFKNCLLGDVMLLKPPTHIALAALQYGLKQMDKMDSIFRDHIHRLCQVDEWNANVENTLLADKLIIEVNNIIDLVERQSVYLTQEERQTLQKERIPTFMQIQSDCDDRQRAMGHQPMDVDNIDSDDD